VREPTKLPLRQLRQYFSQRRERERKKERGKEMDVAWVER